jgi:hypothetical protein
MFRIVQALVKLDPANQACERLARATDSGLIIKGEENPVILLSRSHWDLG